MVPEEAIPQKTDHLLNAVSDHHASSALADWTSVGHILGVAHKSFCGNR
jgi:hypothetical protein